MSASYNRGAKQRKETAMSRDPMAYSLHKRGVEGAEICCDCGEKLKNTKYSRAYHCHRNRVHLNWLKSLTLDDADELVPDAIDEGDANAVAAAASTCHDSDDVVPDAIAEGDAVAVAKS
jgi:hypothetical protein